MEAGGRDGLDDVLLPLDALPVPLTGATPPDLTHDRLSTSLVTHGTSCRAIDTVSPVSRSVLEMIKITVGLVGGPWHKLDQNEIKGHKSGLPVSGNDSAVWKMFWCYICHPGLALPPACVSAGLLSWFVEI